MLLHDVATPYVEPMLAAVLRQAEAEFDVEAWEMESGYDKENYEIIPLLGILLFFFSGFLGIAHFRDL